jgi:hypothetical protein
LKATLFCFFALNAFASAYTLVYDIYTSGFRTGQALLVSTEKSVSARFRVAPFFFFRYEYSTECVMDDHRGSIRENIREIINGKTNLFDYSFFSGDFVRTNRTLSSPPQVFTNHWKPGRPLSLFVLLDRFIRKYDNVSLDNLIFIRERIDRFHVIGFEKNTWRIKEENGQYAFKLHYVPMADLRIPELIAIEKYRFFGIDWSIITLRLHSFSQEEGAKDEEKAASYESN